MSNNNKKYDINYDQLINRGGSFLVLPFSKGDVFSREDFTEDQKMFSMAAEEFAIKRMEPIHKELDVLNKELSVKIFREMGELGFCGIDIPEKFGGLELDKTTACIVADVLSKGKSASMMVTFSAHTGIGTLPIIWYGNEAQKKRYLPNMINGKWTGTMNLTEPHAGSDLALIKTKAKPFKDSYKLYGNKIFITHGDQNMSDNIIHLVLARLPDAPKGVKGISLFLVPKKLYNEKNNNIVKNDIRVVSTEHKLGHIASHTCVMAYGVNEGAIGELIGKPNQ